ncbi:MAG TPA: type IV pilus secretin PilQ family protein, partial [Pseudoxanthomonas sp.]|nr:type IV pilus secretin PilQ family protein [Pseudoxanthomonas sp.]
KPKVSQIDFKRGDGGAGRLILRFDGEGAAPDLRNRDGSVVVDVSNAILPVELQRPLNVTDFATPVQRIEAKPHGGGAQLVLSTRGAYESLAYQTGNEYVVEVSPRAAAAVGATGSGATGVNARIAKQGYSGKPVTFNFQDVPVRTVLQLIAEESNLNIVASDTVAGNVTLRLDNVPWDQAMDIVLRAKGLDKRKDGNVIWVAPQPELAAFEKAKEDARIDLENRVDLVTDYIQINYHSAAAIFKSLTEAKGIGNSGQGGGGGGGDNQENGFLSQRGRIVADERTNTLMISDIPKKVAQMRELINVIDRPVDQVLIESRIVIATDTFARDLGARFGVQGRDLGNNTRVISGSLDNNATIINEGKYNIPGGLNFNLPAVTTNGANVGAIAYTLLGANFAIDVELSALQQEGRGEVLSNPRVVTSNQREAIIRQGRQVGYVTLTGGGNQAFPTPTVEFKDVVLELKVTPTITSDDRVFMAVHVTKDEILRFIDTSIGQVPEIATREINTAVLVDDGQTVVIGGVYEFTDANSVAKVPFLGDVPFLGNLFKKKSRSKDKAELLIFLTPKVMRVEKRT